jgi:hypothetical protein
MKDWAKQSSSSMIRITPVSLGVLSQSFTASQQDRNLPITQRTSPEEEEQIQQATR